jgi:hypothetical protein
LMRTRSILMKIKGIQFSELLILITRYIVIIEDSRALIQLFPAI